MGADAEVVTARDHPGDGIVTATSDTRPRSSRLPRHERRRQLLDAALEVFVSQGYHAAAMDDIAERAGVSKPVLYQHFPGKLELYLALLDESVGTLLETVGDALRSNLDPKQRVAATFGGYFEYVGGKGQAYRLVFESDLSNEPAVRERLEAVRRRPFRLRARDEQGRQDSGARGQDRLRRIRRPRGAPRGLRQHRLTGHGGPARWTAGPAGWAESTPGTLGDDWSME